MKIEATVMNESKKIKDAIDAVRCMIFGEKPLHPQVEKEMREALEALKKIQKYL